MTVLTKNEFEKDSTDPIGDQKRMAELQKTVKDQGGFRRIDGQHNAGQVSVGVSA